MRDAAAIVGIGHTEFVKDIGRPERTIALEAITAALDDAGLTASDVDGLVKFTMETTVEVEIARASGLAAYAALCISVSACCSDSG